ncbi:MAG: TonB-dependent receptor [Cytophagales bacterium]|nr:TonB-dependent receptor [Cytophagales bacterium]
MMEKLLRKPWGVLAVVVLFATAVSARDLALLRPNTISANQPDKSMQTLKSYLDHLSKHHRVSIGYDASLIENAYVSKSETISDDIDKDLKKVLKPHRLKFEKIKKDHYVIVSKSKRSSIKELKKASLVVPALDQHTLLASGGNAVDVPEQIYQEKVVTGKVVSGDNSEPLPGVNIIVKGTTTGGISDLNGNYSVSVPDDNASLIFSSVGYETIEVAVGTQSVIDVSLVPDITALSEIVVVGYGTQEKRDVTAAIASLDSEDITKIPVASSVEAIQGQISGVDVVGVGGRPGSNPTITIRGRQSISSYNDPLYVIDGIPQTESNDRSAINDLNPADIESMEVLKDAAAAAIYGSRAANGVILITTKRGKAGKTVVSYDGFYGTTSLTKSVDMMNGEEFANMKRESRRLDEDGNAFWNGTIPDDAAIFEDPAEFESLSRNPVRSTDYQDLIFKNGFKTNHQVGISGGSEKTQFNISLGYFKEDGIIKGMDFERFNSRINLDHKISKIFKVGVSFLASHSIRNEGSGDVLDEAMTNNPLGVPYDEETGELLFLPISDGIRTNPLFETLDNNVIDETKATRIFAPIYLEVDILKNLKYRMNFGPDIRYTRRGEFNGSFTNNNRGGPADARIRDNNQIGITLENILTWNETINDRHGLGVTLLQSIQSNRLEYHSTEVSNLPYESQLFYNLGSAAVKGNLESSLTETALASFMGRINYDFDKKYLLQFTLRADGSSRLAEGKKWDYFPGVSAGWRIIDEGFMSGVNAMNELKLRASYGILGNTSIAPYQTWGRLERRAAVGAFGYQLSEIPNDQLGWEVSATTDIGVDFGFFDGRLSGTFDWFNTETTDLIQPRQLPPTSGYAGITQNIGSTRTRGVELALNGVVLDNPNGFNWDINFNIAHYKEEITELALKDENGNPTDDVINRWFIGQPIIVYFDYEKEGIYQIDEEDLARQRENKVPGEIKLKDQNKDNVITVEDRKILGSTVPDFYGGITNNFEYKGFDLSIFFYYRVGHMIFSSFETGNSSLFARYNNLDVDYWTVNNPTNDHPRPDQNQERPRDGDTRGYFDGSYLKLRNVTLGYTFPSSITEKLRMSFLRVYVSAQNPWFTSKYDTFDPEIGEDVVENSTRDLTEEGLETPRVNSNTIPTNKTFLFGINFKF